MLPRSHWLSNFLMMFRAVVWRPFSLFLWFLLINIHCFSAQAEQMALFRLDPLGVDPARVERLAGLLRLELGRLADAAIPSQEQIQRLLQKTPKLQNCTGEIGCLIEVGGKLGVQKIISGNVGGLAQNYVVNLKLVDVQKRQEIRRIQETMSGQADQLIEAVRLAAYRLVAPEKLRGSLAVLADQPGAEVHLNSQLLGKTPLPPQQGLMIGSYTLRLSKPGYTEVIKPIEVHFQKTTRALVNMDPPPPPISLQTKKQRQVPPRPVPWYTRWWFWTTVAVVAAGAGVGLGYAVGGKATGINCNAEPERCGL